MEGKAKLFGVCMIYVLFLIVWCLFRLPLLLMVLVSLVAIPIILGMGVAVSEGDLDRP